MNNDTNAKSKLEILSKLIVKAKECLLLLL